VTEGKAAQFGEPRLLNLGGLGIRSLASYGNEYLIVAGPYDGDEASELYRWDGESEHTTRVVAEMAGNPEGLALIRKGGRETIFVLNDDGTETVNNRACKKLKDDQLKVFRGYEMELKTGMVVN
jgi:hypothetical protein